MSIESVVGGLSHLEKIEAMELIWIDLTERSPEYASPAWHKAVLDERTKNPSAEKSLGLDESKAEILKGLHARRTQA